MFINYLGLIILHFIFHILSFKVIKIVTVNKGPFRFYYFFLYKIFVLPCLMMASVQAETCSTHVQAPNWIEINLCCVKLNKCSLFSNKHNGRASMHIRLKHLVFTPLAAKWEDPKTNVMTFYFLPFIYVLSPFPVRKIRRNTVRDTQVRGQIS